MVDDYTTKKKKMVADAERESAAKDFISNERSMGRTSVGEGDQDAEDDGTKKLEKLGKYERKPLPSIDMRTFEPMSEAVRTKDAMNRDKLNAAKK
jgi:hypothetical protein